MLLICVLVSITVISTIQTTPSLLITTPSLPSGQFFCNKKQGFDGVNNVIKKRLWQSLNLQPNLKLEAESKIAMIKIHILVFTPSCQSNVLFMFEILREIEKGSEWWVEMLGVCISIFPGPGPDNTLTQKFKASEDLHRYPCPRKTIV